ncbi:hypothetical protein BCR42DRAFT_421353 [Absidia repens]|uniref:Uncharacterized protein n=1 Tax=Absidia repens TaxID=90262 RepID=A0A1X2I8E2_9FUNG|nr:hypothetical protein BCR42DRAFT_421353 [Absidia repens]
MHIGLNGDGDDLIASHLMVPQTKNRRPFVFCNFFFLHRAITCIESQGKSI